jgi:hypothetical protein
MNETLVAGIGLLFIVSLLVRVAPAFVPLPISDRMAERIETLLPVAVFINLAAYCAVSEINADWIPGTAGFATLVVLFPLLRQIGLIVVVALSTTAYLLAREYETVIAGALGLA